MSSLQTDIRRYSSHSGLTVNTTDLRTVAPCTPIFCSNLSTSLLLHLVPWRQRQQLPPERSYRSIYLSYCKVTSQKALFSLHILAESLTWRHPSHSRLIPTNCVNYFCRSRTQLAQLQPCSQASSPNIPCWDSTRMRSSTSAMSRETRTASWAQSWRGLKWRANTQG